MRVQLIAKREPGMTGTSRYTSDLTQGFHELGLDAQLTFPDQATIPTTILGWLRYWRLDPQAFFASYPLHASLQDADIYHLTGQMLATLLLFQRFPKPVVVTVLDIIPYIVRDVPELNTFRHTADTMFYQLALSGLRRANGLIAISNYTRQTLVEMLNLPEERIEVIYPGVDTNKFQPIPPPDDFWGKYGLVKGERYILYVGSEDPRKNLSTLIQAFAQVKKERPGVKLLKVGTAQYNQERRKLQNLLSALDLVSEVLFKNYVPEEDLPCFYNAAEALVLPSLYEGFGLPVVEAMACGTPVVSSWAGSLPEVVGNAGVQVNPGDPQAMAEALLALLDNPGEQSRLKEAGLQRVARFTLEQSACATEKFYTKITQNALRQEPLRTELD